MPGEVEPVGDVVAGLGEGPWWDAATATLLWLDIPGGMLHRTDPVSGDTSSRDYGAPLAMVVQAADGGLVLARGDELLVLPPGTDEPRPWTRFPARPNMRLNDGTWDRQRRLLVGTMVLPQQDGGPAALWRVSTAGERHELVSGLRLSNGVAWSPDGTRLYHVDTPVRRIWAHDVDAAGDITTSTSFADVEAGAGNPDGLTVDAEGHVWVCLFGGWSVRRYTPDGRIERELRLPVEHPTSCAFGGPDLATLFVTTASNRLDAAGRTAQPLAGHLLAARPGPVGFPGVRGVPPHDLTQFVDTQPPKERKTT